MRIVSLLPSATEIICSVGLQQQLVGVTHECDFPAGVADLPVVTRSRIPKGLTSTDIDALVRTQLETDAALYALEMDTLARLQPDLIISQSLCDVCAVAADAVQAAARQLPGQPQVMNLEPASLDDVFDTIVAVGEATGAQQQAARALAELRSRVQAVASASRALPYKPRVAMLEWLDPLFNAGHWTPQLVELAGGSDCLGNPLQPSTTITWEQLAAADPDVIVVALCGFDVARSRQDVALIAQQPQWRTLRAVRNRQVYVVDGNAYFSRPGPRLVDSLELLATIVAPAARSLAG